jgi:hypothetical protein
VYTSISQEQEALRKWTANVEIVANSNSAESQVDWKMGLNEFADMSAEEFAGRMNGYVSRGHVRPNNVHQHKASGIAPPASVDWRTKGLVTDVKNQGSCGSCTHHRVRIRQQLSRIARHPLIASASYCEQAGPSRRSCRSRGSTRRRRAASCRSLSR